MSSDDHWSVRGVPAEVKRRFALAAEKQGCTIGALAVVALEQTADRVLSDLKEPLPVDAQTQIEALQRQLETMQGIVSSLRGIPQKPLPAPDGP